MLKKLARLFKMIFVGVVWTAIFLFAARLLLVYVWHFDIFSQKQWIVIAGYWNNNGVIMTVSDYLFFVTLLGLLVIWIIGWRWFSKADYLKIILFPLEYITNYEIKKYESEDQHTPLKNISSIEKKNLEDLIQERIKKEKGGKSSEAQQLRKNVFEKIIRRKDE